MTIKPTIVYASADPHGKHVLSAWQAIPGVSEHPVIQIDHNKSQHGVIEFRKEDAPALAAAILKAAEDSE